MLVLDNIHVYYGMVHALKGVSLTVEKGQIVALLGANGAGKTTTLRAISGLMRPAKGEISFAGERISGRAVERIVKAGIIQCPEGRQVFPQLTVLENMRLGAFTRRDRRRILDDMNVIFGVFPILRERKKQIAGTLSGGEQQMLAIARALMGSPRLLLLDEPSLGLAPLAARDIFAVVRTIRDNFGTPVLLVEQNARQAMGIADYAYILETGKVILSGASAQLREDEGVRRSYLGEK